MHHEPPQVPTPGPKTGRIALDAHESDYIGENAPVDSLEGSGTIRYERIPFCVRLQSVDIGLPGAILSRWMSY